MHNTSEWITMDDKENIFVRKWFKNEKPAAILQLSHGMAEHIDRYDSFANFLLHHGIYVYGNDHRGHGRTGERKGIYGFFSEENGFDRVVKDLFEINQTIQKEYPDVPIILMGHSMGSFLVRRYIQQYPDSIKGVILSGTGGDPGIAGKLGKQIAKREIRKHGMKSPSFTLNRLSFGSFNKGIESPRTEFDWLSKDPSEVKKYVNDPFCGFVCSAGYFYDLFTGLERIHNNKFIQLIPKELPIFIFSGEKDPVGKNKKGVEKVIKQYEQNGLTNIEVLFFKDGRHEMLNETNREEVYNAITSWIRKQLNLR